MPEWICRLQEMTQCITGRESRREYSVKPQGMLVALLPIIDYNISVNIVVYL